MPDAKDVADLPGEVGGSQMKEAQIRCAWRASRLQPPPLMELLAAPSEEKLAWLACKGTAASLGASRGASRDASRGAVSVATFVRLDDEIRGRQRQLERVNAAQQDRRVAAACAQVAQR